MGQTAKEEIANNLRLSASNLLAYMGPQKRLSPAPDGWRPFHISHYGSHGSCYLTSMQEYDYSLNTLRRASTAGKLTLFGENILLRLEVIRQDVEGRQGELTLLGAEQQKQIARRMYERFPEVFAGSAHVDAKSTVTIRSLLSMENALQQFLLKNPRLRITHDASMSDMYYMDQKDTLLEKAGVDMTTGEPFQMFYWHHDRPAQLMERLFNDTAYIKREVNASLLNYSFFKVASNIQNTEQRKHLTLYDAYSDEELYQNWLRENARYYLGFAASPQNDGRQPFSQRNLLRRIILEADSCIGKGQPCASLRFGHERALLSLVCLLDLNGYGQQINDLEQIDRKGWRNYRIIPMSANIQFVFYCRNTRDTDVIFKVLLNEDEVTLPLKTNMAPYYRWKDFKEYYVNILNSYSGN